MLDQVRLFLFESQLLPWLLIAILASAVWSGRRLGTYFRQRAGGAKLHPDEISVAAIFGLMSLFVTFTFSGAYERYDERRSLLVAEYNTISTAYLAVDLLPTESQAKIREGFRQMMDERMSLYKNVEDSEAFNSQFKAFDQTLNQLWKDAIAAVDATPYPKYLVAAQLLTSISAMNDALENRRMALKQHPPSIIYTLLGLMLVIGAFIAGYNQGSTDSHDWTLVPIYVFLSVAVFYITINLEHPLVGVITLDDYLEELVALRQTM